MVPKSRDFCLVFRGVQWYTIHWSYGSTDMCSEKHLGLASFFPKAPALRRSWRCARAGKSERVCRGRGSVRVFFLKRRPCFCAVFFWDDYFMWRCAIFFFWKFERKHKHKDLWIIHVDYLEFPLVKLRVEWQVPSRSPHHTKTILSQQQIEDHGTLQAGGCPAKGFGTFYLEEFFFGKKTQIVFIDFFEVIFWEMLVDLFWRSYFCSICYVYTSLYICILFWNIFSPLFRRKTLDWFLDRWMSKLESKRKWTSHTPINWTNESDDEVNPSTPDKFD